MNTSRTQSKYWTLLPIGWRLLLEAKKISRHLSLVLTVAGMLMLSFTALWKPWIHFQVPLGPPGDPAGPKTIPIDTIFFMRCPDISCMNEYDKNAWINIILGVLFYLMQARKFLQEGMTYTLGSSFYLAWINVFFFFMIGLAGLWSLLLPELYQLLVYPVTPGHVVLRHNNKLTPMVCLGCQLPDNPPLYSSYVTSDSLQPRIPIYT
ncbi:uncharacterized protein LOC114637567 isoform X3 [Grammomys surdaster]|uniref:uncharacterized protein LOC114637567 isoform X3 n=1 Tax=Grammomys surdaster TaxID=491861 RepID=UPI0010A01C5C|nr:uncharacterized protein LOC114637567 isoform X3 [Grammomys surdaster]